MKPDEFLLRAIPNAKGYYSPDAPDLQVNPYNFEPNKKRDPDGLSFFRLDFVTAKSIAHGNRHPEGVYVAILKASDILSLGLTIEPSPDETGPAGHAIIPQMNYPDFKAKKLQFKDIMRDLARLASKRVVYGPTPKRPEFSKSSAPGQPTN